MDRPDTAPDDFTLIALTSSWGSGLALSLDLLAAAATLAPRMGRAAPRWRVCSPSGGLLALPQGLLLRTEALNPAAGDRSTWILPSLATDSEVTLAPMMGSEEARALHEPLRAHLARGGRLCATAASVHLLGAAGLLERRRVTTAWWLAPLLERLAPQARVEPQRAICIDGPVTTCAATLAQTQLMLHLLGRLCGPELARHLATLCLPAGAAGQAADELRAGHLAGEGLVARLVRCIEQSLPETASVTDLARELCVSERTLSRHVRRATGQSTRALVMEVRMSQARALLQRSRLSVDDVAAAVGYSDATALRRLMKRMGGAQPSRYRLSSLPA